MSRRSRHGVHGQTSGGGGLSGFGPALFLGADQPAHVLTVVLAVRDQVSRAHANLPRGDKRGQRLDASPLKCGFRAAAGSGCPSEHGAGVGLSSHVTTVGHTSRQHISAVWLCRTSLPHRVA